MSRRTAWIAQLSRFYVYQVYSDFAALLDNENYAQYIETSSPQIPEIKSKEKLVLAISYVWQQGSTSDSLDLELP